MEQAGSEYEANGKMEDATRQRLVKGYGWMKANDYTYEMWQFAEENNYDYFMESIRKAAEGITEQPKRRSLREMHGEYCETMGIRYNHATRQYENI